MLAGALLMFIGSGFGVWVSLHPEEGAAGWTALWLVVAAVFAFLGVSLLVQRRQ